MFSRSQNLAALLVNPEQVATMAREHIPDVLGDLEALRARLVLRLNATVRDAEQGREPLLTCAHVAEQIGASQQRVYELCRTDRLPHVRLGRQVRVAPAALREWIANGGKV